MREMKKQASIRQVGQRSITSTSLFRPLNRSIEIDKLVEIKAPAQKKGSHLSLSDFLKRKLQKKPELPSTKGKELPFSSPLSSENFSPSITAESAGVDRIFKMLKDVGKDKKECSNSSNDMPDMNIKQTVKRKHVCEGNDDKPSARKKVLAVLGDDLEPAYSRKKKNFARGEGFKPLFNHYGNGGGWWDNNMEGIDSEEVGCSDVWEGMGSTTLGGIEWH